MTRSSEPTPSPPDALRQRLADLRPILALAPMQDITDLPFWRVMAAYGGPDVYFTEYFRVFPGSHLNRGILQSITENPTGRPAVAQLIGNDVTELVRSARELQAYPVAAVDLNLGCPAPVVYRKCAGGGLLRDPQLIDTLLGALRDALTVPFTVKTRVGFDSAEGFDALLPIFARHRLDLLTVHGRTVAEMYRTEVRYHLIARAASVMPCPVLANGNVHSAAKAAEVLRLTGARGLMIGRGAIRNPWIFTQIRQRLAGEPGFTPTGRDVLAYVHTLYEALRPPGLRDTSFITKLKKHMNYLGLGVEPTGAFLHRIRRVTTRSAFFAVCAEYLDHDRPMALEPMDLGLQPKDVMAGSHE